MSSRTKQFKPRLLPIEPLEARFLLTGWQNAVNHLNINDDALNIISFDDTALILDELHDHHFTDPITGRLRDPIRPDGEPYLDADGDGFVTPVDLVRVWNGIHTPAPVSLCRYTASGLQVFTVPSINRPTIGTRLDWFDPLSEAFVGSLKPKANAEMVIGTALLNDDLIPDVVGLGESEVQIFLGTDAGVLAEPVVFATGPAPVALAIGDYLSDKNTDIVVGHDNGEVHFFEGNGSGEFAYRPDRTIHLSGGLLDITKGDFDQDGQLDFAASSGSDLMLFLQRGASTETSSVINGSFSDGLFGWQVTATGHDPGTAGFASAANGRLRISENSSFLTSVQQELKITPSSRTLSFDLIDEALTGSALGEIPDGFEVSLLDSDGATVLPTIRPGATSFFNVEPGGEIRIADGVTVSGNRVMVDISRVPEGTATLIFDLIGANQSFGSRVTIDNVVLESEPVVDSRFESYVVANAPDLTSIVSCYRGDDSWLDVLAHQRGVAELQFFANIGEPLAEPTEAMSPSSNGLGPNSSTARHTNDSHAFSTNDRVQQHNDGASGIVKLRSRLGWLAELRSKAASRTRIADSNETSHNAKFYIVDQLSDANFQYAPDGTSLGDFSLAPGNQNATGVTTSNASNPVWVVDQNRFVFVYDTRSQQRVGAWQADGIVDPQGIATNGSDIWIVDDESNRVYFYADAANTRSGVEQYETYFSLTENNTDPSGITTDGTSLWVSDHGDDAVYVYSLEGNLIGTWYLDPFNCDASGITINPNGGSDLWVVDQGAAAVFYYRDGASFVDGHRVAQSQFGLANANTRATGIADPDFLVEIGDVAVGSIAEVTQVDNYRFDATAGQRLYFDSQSRIDLQTWTLASPAGDELGGGFLFQDFGPVEIAESGQYTVSIASYSDQLGDYQFQIWEVPPLTTRAIEVGEVVGDAIDVPGEADAFTFLASAGQRLYFDSQGAPGFHTWMIQSPSGEQIRGDLLRDFGPIEMTESGTYTITVAATGDQRGAYGFQIWDVPEPTTQTIEIGEVVGDAIDIPGEADAFTFLASTGQRLFFDNQGTVAHHTWVIHSPSGEQIRSDLLRDFGPFEITETGVYTIVVNAIGDQLGEYQFQIWDSTPVNQLIDLNQTIAAPMAPRQEFTYRFSADEGMELYFDVSPVTSSDVLFTLSDPSGQQLFADSKVDHYLEPLQLGGTHVLTIAMSVASSPDTLGFFEFRVQERFEPPTVGLRDSQGTDFWLAFPPASIEQNLSLYISAEEKTQVIVTAPGREFVAAADVTPGELSVIEVPATVTLGGDRFQLESDIIENKGVRIISETEVTVYAVLDAQFTSDAYLGLPVDAIGTEYFVLAYPWGVAGLTRGPSQFGVVATEDGTTVTIVPSIDTGDRQQGEAFDITLDTGQSYYLSGGNFVGHTGLSGTYVQADKPISLFSGNPLANIPVTVRLANHIVEQLPPTDTWGREFLTLPLAARTGGDTFRLIASHDNTVVMLNDEIMVTLNRGEFHERLIDGPAVITSNEPILLAQYANGTEFDQRTGDPFMMLVTPHEQFRSEYTIGTPDYGFTSHFVNVIARADDIATIVLDGEVVASDQFMPIGDGPFVGAQLPIDAGEHRITAEFPIGVNVYGFGEADSYGYPGGTAAAPVALVTLLESDPANAAALTGTEHTVTTIVTDSNGEPLADVRVDYEVTGVNQGRGFSFSNPDGMTTFTYVGLSEGEDAISASVGPIVDTVSVRWVTAAPEIEVESPTNGAQFPIGTNVLFTGRAIPGPSQGQITAITLNNVAVGSVDITGRFFAPVSVLRGINDFKFQAIDQFGQVGMTHIQLVGVDAAPVTSDQFTDITTLGTLTYTGTTFNRTTNSLLVQANLVNQSEQTIFGPVIAAFHSYRPSDVFLASATGNMNDGREFVVFDTELTGGLSTDSLSAAKDLTFSNPARQRFDFEVDLLNLANTAPVFEAAPLTLAAADQEYSYSASARDNEQTSLHYRLQQSPLGMQIDQTSGLITWSPIISQIGNHPVTIVADDLAGGVTQQSFQIEVVADIPNRPPRFISAPQTQIATGESFVYFPEAFDADQDPLAFSLPTAPAGTVFSSETGQIRLLQPVDGTYSFELHVTDGNSGAAAQTFTVSVGETTPNTSIPSFSSTPPHSVVVGSNYVYFPQATDSDGDEVTYSVVESPSGLTFDATINRIDFVPTIDQIGSHAVFITASDGKGGIASQTFTVNVLPEPVNQAPIIESIPPRYATQGVAIDYTIVARDPEGEPALSYRVNQGPSGMTVNPFTGTVGWTPAADQLGPFVVELMAVDSDGKAGFQRFELEVRRPNEAPVFVTEPITSVEAGAEYRYDSQADDAEDAVSYRLLEGPPRMTVGSLNGIVFWKSDPGDVSTHPVTIRATDERGLFVDQSFQIQVGGDTQPPSVTVHLGTNVVTPGEVVRIDVTAFDNVSVRELQLEIDGVRQELDVNQGMFFTATRPDLVRFVGRAVDEAGNLGIGTADLRIIDENDEIAPEIVIVSPQPQTTVDYLTDIIGTVVADDLEFFRVQIALLEEVDLANQTVDDLHWSTISEGHSDVTNGLLGTLDPTLLRNDAYALRVIAQDFSGNIHVVSQPINIDGNAKIGEFAFDAVDLSIPLDGIPIEMTRSYSTFDAKMSGDFGRGWTLQLMSPNIRETVPSSDGGIFSSQPFKIGTRVFLTNPEGKRISFTFQPTPTATLFGTVWHPHFEADFGTADRLEVEDVGLTQRADGTFGYFLFGFGYNPDSYTLVTRDQTRYTYNQLANPELQRIVNKNGVTLTVDDFGIHSSSGAEIVWRRDELGRIAVVTDPGGNEILYQYNAMEQLETVTNQVGDVTTMNYLSASPGFLESILDARGNQVLGLEYDENGRLVAQLDAFGNAVRLEHDVTGQRETIFDLAGNATTLLFDQRGNVLEETDPAGNVTFREYADPRNPDAETKIIDRRGFVTEQQFDERGNLLKSLELGPQDAPFAEPITTTFTYNGNNDVTSVTDGRGNTTLFRYVGANLDEIENARGDVASFTYHGNGDVETFTDFRGNTTEFRDYKSGQPQLIIFADDTEQRLDYNQFGRTTYEAFFEADGTLVQERRSEFDAAGRLIKEIAGSDIVGSKTERRLFYEGDLLDWEIIVHPDSLDAGGNLIESPATPVANRHSSITDYEYDAASRLIQQTDAEGGVIKFRYDAQGNRVALMDPVGNITTWLYDARNRPIEERDPLYWDDVRTSIADFEALSPNAFFELVASVSLNSGEDPLYDDPSGASCETMTGAEHVILSCYDAEGNQAMTIDRNGRRREFEYEFDGELAEERWYSLERDLIRTMSFGYDAARNINFASDPDSTYFFTYDSLNQLDTVDNAGTPRVPNIILDYQFDAQGNPESVSDNLGVTVASQYNDRNLLEYRQWFDASGNDAVSPLRVDFLYNAAGRISDMFRYADLDANELVGQVHRGYDLAGRSDAISFNDAVDRVLAGYDSGYDELGRMDSDSRAGITSTYRHDLTGQLVSATRSNGNNESFSYDANGNRTLPGYMTGIGNRLEADGNFIYRYDGEGNRISKTEIDSGKVTRYAFDYRNRLIRVTEQEVGGEEVELAAHTYDALNTRIIIDTAERVTITIYDREQAWAEFNEAGEVTTRYLYDDQIDFLIAIVESSEQPVFVNTDLLGSVVGYMGHDGALLNTVAYGAFGEIASGSLMGRVGFTGREHETATDLYFYRARFYDPGLGRFASEDPLRFRALDTNFYRYVINRPAELIDPTGEATAVSYVKITAIGATIGAAAGAACGGSSRDILVTSLGGAIATNLLFTAFWLSRGFAAIPTQRAILGISNLTTLQAFLSAAATYTGTNLACLTVEEVEAFVAASQ